MLKKLKNVWLEERELKKFARRGEPKGKRTNGKNPKGIKKSQQKFSKLFSYNPKFYNGLKTILPNGPVITPTLEQKKI